MKNFAIICMNENNSSEIFFGRFEKIPGLRRASAELKLRNRKCKVVAVVEVSMDLEQNCVYESMAWRLSPMDKSAVLP